MIPIQAHANYLAFSPVSRRLLLDLLEHLLASLRENAVSAGTPASDQISPRQFSANRGGNLHNLAMKNQAKIDT
ncbi:hypothetical protein A3K78_07395 [Candidatus Bathyarchaeota archaeon RBG_13_52_12]|nr:MAG: hypothetical protein A3K78_07395 [Candidatus Bathyarchaeota archaeon RBG_13_52_12]